MADLLLDSNIIILHLRQRGATSELLLRWGLSHELYISVITRLEILAGMHQHEELATRRLLDSLSSLPVSAAIADQAGRLIYNSARQGLRLSFPDALIAATALEHRLTLVTTNVRHFAVPGLQVQSFPLA